MSATIKDIAKEIGLSTAAVSKALNGKGGVSTETREEIMKIAKRMGYTRNTMAASLVTKTTKTIGVFLLSRNRENVRGNISMEILGAIMEEADVRGYDIVLYTANNDLRNGKTYVELCKSRKIDAVIFLGLKLDDPHISELIEIDIPVAAFDTFIENSNINMIETDNNAGIEMALDYLWSLGHRKIGMLNGYRKAQVSQRRHEVFKNYMTKKGIYNEKLVYEGDYTKKSGYVEAQKMTESRNLPTAIFAASDMMALGAIEYFVEKGIRVPEEISVVGYDDVIMSEYSTTKLTTIGQDVLRIGKELVRCVLEKQKGKIIKVEPRFIIRNSCAVMKQE
jgi:LacI family transcriptional regulator/LacI family purine nucleotide synthesis repressor